MTELTEYQVLSPVSARGKITKTGTVALTADEAKRLLNLPEPPIVDPDADMVVSEKPTGTDAGGTDDTGDSNPEPLTEARIVEAIGQLDPDNTEHWTNGNAPQIHALKEVLGEVVSATERDAAWETYQANPSA